MSPDSEAIELLMVREDFLKKSVDPPRFGLYLYLSIWHSKLSRTWPISIIIDFAEYAGPVVLSTGNSTSGAPVKPLKNLNI